VAHESAAKSTSGTKGFDQGHACHDQNTACRFLSDVSRR